MNRAELRRRKEQSNRDREQNRREKQSQRDRERNQRERLLQNLYYNTRAQGPPFLKPLLPVSENMSFLSHASTKKTEPLSGSLSIFASLFNNTKYSDVTIYLGKSKITFHGHRLMLGIRSPYFDDALESNFLEATTREFVFEDESPHALWRVFQYMYQGDYSMETIEALEQEGDDLELLKHPRVYALADMFRMEDLKELSSKKLKSQLEQHWISDTFVDCIREVYATSVAMDGPVTRTIVVDTVVMHMKELVEKRSFQDLIRETGDFAVDVMVAIAKANSY